jgi:ribose transport system ATP-binding protein
MRRITKAFPGVVALDRVDFDLKQGEVHVLLGENGAGKSTLMKILSGAYAKDSGEIQVGGKRVEIKGPGHAQDIGISTIYQEFNLIPHLTAAENIFLGREPTTFAGFVDRTKLEDSAQQLLKDLGVTLDARLPVSELSVAQQQMVEVAKALSVEAQILIMDEPTSALTESEISALFGTIRRLKKRDVAIIYISHRLEEISRIGDRVTVLRDGQWVATHQVSEVPLSELIRLMANRELTEHFPKQIARLGEELLRVDKLSKANELDDVSFSLKAGEILGFAGLVGAGRTALAKAIFGVHDKDSGRIRIKGKTVNIKSPGAAIRHGIGFLTEDRKHEGLVLSLSVKNNISLPSTDLITRHGIVKESAERQLAERFIRELRVKTTGPGQLTLNLSGGNQQKVVLAKWLARQADILIFDEPTRGIDVGSKIEIYQLMNELTARGTGILMISSELPEVLGMSDRIIVMRDGRITGEFDRQQATQENVLAAALGQAESTLAQAVSIKKESEWR